MIALKSNIALFPISTFDAKQLFDIITRERIYLSRFLGWVSVTFTLTHVHKFINICLNREKETKATFFLIKNVKTKTILGSVSINSINLEKKEAVLGYWVIESMQKKGLATLSVQKIMDYLRQELKIETYIIYCSVNNPKGRGVPKRLDFRYQGVLKNGEFIHDKYQDLDIYIKKYD